MKLDTTDLVKCWTEGRNLRVGDTIIVNGRRDRIVSLNPYTGTLSSLWHGKAMIAALALCKAGMTIEPELIYEN